MSVDTDRVAQLEADLAAVWERKRELDRVEVELRADIARLRAVADAAGRLVEVQRRAAKAFRTGFEDMPSLVRSSGPHRMIADEMAAAGKKLQRAVDDLEGRAS